MTDTQLLDALDWKLMHESELSNSNMPMEVQNDDNFLISNQVSCRFTICFIIFLSLINNYAILKIFTLECCFKTASGL